MAYAAHIPCVWHCLRIIERDDTTSELESCSLSEENSLLTLSSSISFDLGSEYTRKVKAFMRTLENDDVGAGKIDSLKPSSIKPPPQPPDATQSRDPGEPEEESEWGPLPQQRELREYSPNTGVACDGADCPYQAATLPGTRGRRGSYFSVEPLNISTVGEEKDLLEHLIKHLGQPCEATCAPPRPAPAGAAKLGHRFSAANFGGNVAACEAACRAHKVDKVRALMAEISRLRSENSAAVAEDAKRAKEEEKDSKQTATSALVRRIYSEIKNGTGSLEAPEQTYTDQEELDCSVSARTKEVCSLCGGGTAFRFRGYRVEMMAPREQRFVPQYPFGSRMEQNMVRRVLKSLSPAAINTMSLAGHGALSCISSSPPPMVAQSLATLGVNLSEWGSARGHGRAGERDAEGQPVDDWSLMMGMPTIHELRSTPVSSVRVHYLGRHDVGLHRATAHSG